VLKRLSLGYNGLLADIYWTRVVQYFGGKHHEKSMEYKLLAPLLDITTTLDPQLQAAYEFGAIFLSQNPPQGAGDPDAAVALVQRGIRQNPRAWRLYYNLGYIHYIERGDYKAAAQAFEEGSKIPGAHPWMRIMAAIMAQHGGEIQTARYLWEHIYESTTDTMIKDNAVRHLAALRVDEEVGYLQALVRQFQENTGKHPTDWFQMISAGYLRRLPTDPTGKPYKLMPHGRVEVQDPESLPFITRGLPPGVEAPKFLKSESN
jgi:tetratricopeptide (TPR) repeat protein